MLLDDLMPRYDVVERHRTTVRAAPATVFAAIRRADLAGGPIASALMALRLLPAAIVGLVRSPSRALAELRERRARGQGRGAVRLAEFERAGFHVVAERPGTEIVIGLLGRFWTPRGGLCDSVSVDDFDAGPPPGFALAGWNFTVSTAAGGGTELATETRVRCAPDARTSFRAYWLVVRPGSGIIRREMLRAIRREAERAQAIGAGDAASGPASELRRGPAS